MGKQLVNIITYGFESSASFFVIYKAGANPSRIGDSVVKWNEHFTESAIFSITSMLYL